MPTHSRTRGATADSGRVPELTHAPYPPVLRTSRTSGVRRFSLKRSRACRSSCTLLVLEPERSAAPPPYAHPARLRRARVHRRLAEGDRARHDRRAVPTARVFHRRRRSRSPTSAPTRLSPLIVRAPARRRYPPPPAPQSSAPSRGSRNAPPQRGSGHSSRVSACRSSRSARHSPAAARSPPRSPAARSGLTPPIVSQPSAVRYVYQIHGRCACGRGPPSRASPSSSCSASAPTTALRSCSPAASTRPAAPRPSARGERARSRCPSASVTAPTWSAIAMPARHWRLAVARHAHQTAHRLRQDVVPRLAPERPLRPEGGCSRIDNAPGSPP